MDIAEQVRDSDGEQDAQNDQRNSQLYQGKAAFSAPFRHARCLLSVPVQKQGEYCTDLSILYFINSGFSCQASTAFEHRFPSFSAVFPVFCTAARKKRPPERTSAAFLKFNGFFTAGEESETAEKPPAIPYYI